MGKKLKIGYVTSYFPAYSETFILNEVLELEKYDIEIIMFSINKTRENIYQDNFFSLKSKVVYLPRFRENPFRYLQLVVKTIFLHPCKFFAQLSFRVRNNRRKLWGAFLAALFISSMVKRDKITHLHAHLADEPALVALFCSRLANIGFSFTAHAADFFIDPFLLNKKLKDCKFAVTVCNYNINYLLQIGKDINKEKIKLIICGVDTEVFKRSKPYSSNKHLFLTVARFMEKKGMTYLIEAFNLLNKKNPDFEAQIIGDGPLKKQIEDEIEKYGLKEKVKLLGPKKSKELLKYYEEATCFVLPCVVAENGDRDSMPVVIKEAMSMELPVISTTEVGVPEMVKDGIGILVPPRDAGRLAVAMEKVLKMDEDELRAMGKKAREMVRSRFELKNEVKKLYELFLMQL